MGSTLSDMAGGGLVTHICRNPPPAVSTRFVYFYLFEIPLLLLSVLNWLEALRVFESDLLQFL
jgi:hypothetical protein